MKTLVKICGIKSVDEARSVLEVGAKFGANFDKNARKKPASLDNLTNKNTNENLQISAQNAISFIGVIFAKSARQVNMQTAREISFLAHSYGVKCVGVFASSKAKTCKNENKFSSVQDENLAKTSQAAATFSSQMRNSKPLMSFAYGYESDEVEVLEYNSLNKFSTQNDKQSNCEIIEICEYCELDVAQIHGEISQNLYANLHQMGLEVWQVKSVSGNENLAWVHSKNSAQISKNDKNIADTHSYKNEQIQTEIFTNTNEQTIQKYKNFDMILYDCKGKNLGGNGTSFDWEILRNLKPFSFGMAGGIGEENVQEAVKFKPFLVDINSKVEDENLQKIPEKIEKILEILNQM